MYRLVVCDLDGTLIGKDEVLGPDALAVASATRAAGAELTIATGRTDSLAEAYAAALGVRVPYIVSNGAKIIENGRVLWRRVIRLAGVREVLELADDMGLSLIYTIDGVEFVHRVTPWVLSQREQFDRYHNERPISEDDWAELVVEKITVMDDVRDGRIARIEELCKALSAEYTFTKYTNKAVEIVHGEANKANALQWVLNYLGIPRKDTIAFGDHQNDIEMLVFAGVGVAVANAIEPTKLVADLVTDLPGAAGVRKVVERLASTAVI